MHKKRAVKNDTFSLLAIFAPKLSLNNCEVKRFIIIYSKHYDEKI